MPGDGRSSVDLGAPDDAVAAGMAPDRDCFLAEKTIAFDGWRTIDRTARPGYPEQVRGATHVAELLLAFFGETLDGAAGPTLDEIAGRYPAVAVGAP